LQEITNAYDMQGVGSVDELIRAKAEELGQLLIESEAFRRFQKARSAIEERSAAQLMLRDFAAKQQRLQLKIMSGEEVSDAERQELEQAWRIINMNPYVREYLQAGQQFEEMWAEVIAILSHAVGLEIPGGADQDQEPQKESQQDKKESISTARSRLWVPGDR